MLIEVDGIEVCVEINKAGGYQVISPIPCPDFIMDDLDKAVEKKYQDLLYDGYFNMDEDPMTLAKRMLEGG
jgi:hypothetical protein